MNAAILQRMGEWSKEGRIYLQDAISEISADLGFDFRQAGSGEQERLRECLRRMLANSSSPHSNIVLLEHQAVPGPNPSPAPGRAPPHPDEIEQETVRYFNIYALRRKWAARFTGRSFTAGAASTQRGEGIFAEVKRQIVGGVGLIELYEQIDSMVDKKTASNIMNMTKLCLRQSVTLLQQPLICSLRDLECAPFVLDLAAAELSRIAMYRHEPGPTNGEYWVTYHSSSGSDFAAQDDPCTADELQLRPQLDAQSGQRWLRHKVTTTSCSCQFPARWGIFCVHMAKVYSVLNIVQVPQGVLSKWWLPLTNEQLAIRHAQVHPHTCLAANSHVAHAIALGHAPPTRHVACRTEACGRRLAQA